MKCRHAATLTRDKVDKEDDLYQPTTIAKACTVAGVARAPVPRDCISTSYEQVGTNITHTPPSLF